MSVNSSKITIYSSPQVEHSTASHTDATEPKVAESSLHHVPKRTTYRVKITNSKDLEALSTAAKLGLTSWVGDQRVRIVGVAQKQISEFSAAKSQVSTSESFPLSADENVNDSLKARHQQICRHVPDTNDICSAASEQPGLHPVCSSASVAVTSDLESCTLSTSSDTVDNWNEHYATCSPLCQTSRDQSPLILSHCQPSGNLQANADNGIYSRHCRNGSSNSVQPWSQGRSSFHSSLSLGLPNRVHYLGTVAVNSNVTANSAVEDSSSAVSSQSVTDAAVITAVRRLTENLNRNQLSNGKQLTAPTIAYIKRNHVQTSWKTQSQPLNHSQNSLAIAAKCLKRPLVEDDRSRVVPPKKMACGVPCSTYGVAASNFSVATNPGAHCRPLTSNNMLNCVAARLGNHSVQSTRHKDCFVTDTEKSSQRTVEVNSNCSSQQRLLLNLVPKLRLPPGPGMQLFILRYVVIVNL